MYKILYSNRLTLLMLQDEEKRVSAYMALVVPSHEACCNIYSNTSRSQQQRCFVGCFVVFCGAWSLYVYVTR